MNNDGIADLIIGNDGAFAMIYLGTALGTFNSTAGIPFGVGGARTMDIKEVIWTVTATTTSSPPIRGQPT